MILAIAITALLAIPTEERTGLAVDTCQTIDRNTFYDDQGRVVFEQMLFWEVRDEKEVIKDWRLIKEHTPDVVHDFARNEYTLTFHDGDATRVVRAKKYRETHFQHDIELRNRDVLPKEYRTLLQKLRTITPHETDLIEE
jgi:hypothetical protein